VNCSGPAATQDTLQRLYKAQPKTKAVLKRAYGYAVFSDLGVQILLGGTGNGKGIVVNNKTKHQTYMKMIELQAGLGVGVDKFRVVFVFDNQPEFDGFVNSGWEIAGRVLQWTGSYMVPFFIARMAYLCALLVIHVLSPKLEPVSLFSSTI
jgi:lipid-binding SYLF domain-containing protein